VPPRAVETRFRGEPAVALTAGDLTATFLPDVGMTGVSLRLRGWEYLALPGGVDALRRGSTAGLPLLAPWANRLASRGYRAAGVAVDLAGVRLQTDGNGLPIHGLLVGKPGWRVEKLSARADRAVLVASMDVDERGFPFPHCVQVTAQAHPTKLVVDTRVTATGRRRVPIAFGWHPYLRLPGTPRGRWTLRLPPRTHLALDARGLPTGDASREPHERAPVGTRTFDDLYALGRDRRFAFEGDDGAAVELHCGTGYEYAQVWVPRGKPFAALEPMTVPTNALTTGATPIVSPGERYVARFALAVT
jgi:galactose mutarotase-like enzyme